jgi:membrane protease YdiL (CAAX protease family)
MKLPVFMERIETWMQGMEASAEKVTNLLLSGTDGFSIAMNLFVVAIMAAVTEEFLFRGVFQRIIGKWTVKPQVIIWTVAVIFSAVHLQFYGFIPRLLMGAYFGYLIYWSKNIWLPVLAHFTNNAVAVIGMSTGKLKDQVFITGDIPESEIILYTIPALISFGLFLLCVKRLRESFKPVKGSFF